jgi:hypothetical protein
MIGFFPSSPRLQQEIHKDIRKDSFPSLTATPFPSST